MTLSRNERWVLLSLGAVLSLTTACTPAAEDESSRVKVYIAKTTGAVGSASASSVAPSSTSLLLSDSSACSGCATDVANVFNMASNFVSFGKMADTYACAVEGMLSDKALPGDGSERVVVDEGQFKLKVAATTEGTRVKSFKIFICEGSATSNTFYVSGTTAEDGTTSLTTKIAGGASMANFKAAITTSGIFSSGSWTNKSLVVSTSFSSIDSKFMVTQNADNMILKGTNNTSSTDNFYYGKFKLLGSNASTYAFDEGSMKAATTYGGAETTLHWDSNGLTSGVTTSLYASDVASATYLPATTFDGNLTSDETWDCSVGSTASLDWALTSAAQAEYEACIK